jgi:hypothetical protein
MLSLWKSILKIGDFLTGGAFFCNLLYIHTFLLHLHQWVEEACWARILLSGTSAPNRRSWCQQVCLTLVNLWLMWSVMHNICFACLIYPHVWACSAVSMYTRGLKIPSQSQLPQALELGQPSQTVPMGKTLKASVNILTNRKRLTK